MPPKTWFNIAFNEATNSNEINIYDQIGYFGISASQFSLELKQLNNTKPLNIRLNSPGGEIFDGMAIYNLLSEYPGEVTVTVDALAASIASVIAMAGDKIKMPESSMMMIHKPWTIALGDANQLRSDANLLDKLQAQIKIAYQSQTNLDDKELDAIINGENSDTPGATWLSAQEAFDKGFATEVVSVAKKDKSKNSIENKIALITSHEMFSKYAMPQKLAACIRPNTDNSKSQPVNVINQGVSIKPINQKEGHMTPEEIKAAQDKAAAEAVVNERKRQSEIRASGKTLNIADSVIEDAIDKNLTFADAAKVFFDEHKKTLSVTQPAPNVSVGADDADKYRAMVSLSLQNASGLIKDQTQQIEARKSGGPTSLHGFYRSALARKGVKNVENLDGHVLVETFHRTFRNELTSVGTSDLPSVLQDTVNKALDMSMQAARVTYPLFTAVKSVKDFRQFTFAKISGISNVKTIKENEGFKIGTLSDKKEVGNIVTKGIFLSLSRQAQINDDLGALVSMGTILGREIEVAKNRDCYDYLYGAAGVGPTMTETARALFNTTEGNYVASSGAAPSTTTLDAAQLAMMTRLKLKANPSDKDEPTGAIPRFMIVSPKHKGAAERLVYSQTYPSATYPAGVYNPYNAQGNNPMLVITEPYLNALDADRWYVAADQIEIPSIIRLTLNGNESPFLEQDISRGDEPLGINFRCYYDWAFMAGDWRGIYCNAGK